MSDMGYGYSEQFGEENGEDLSGQAPAGTEPKWFRDYMDKARQQNQAMAAELNQLRTESRQNKVAKVFEAKGFDPAAASLYGGEPDKVDEWLGTHGALLAKRPEAGQDGAQEGAEGGQAPAGPPVSSVPSEVQEQMQRMQNAGAGAAPTQGSDAELAARIAAANSMDELADIFKSQGSRYDFGI